MNKLNTDIFISKSILLHGNTYDYSLVNYVNYKTKVDIICQVHGIFTMKPNNHLAGQKCPECSGKKRLDTQSFINKANTIHNKKYDYSLVNYVNNKTKIQIICKIHGIFSQTPNDHLSGKGCLVCGGKKQLSNEEFINKARMIHGDKYDYSLCNYNSSHDKVKIICHYHGCFYQTPTAHIAGNNCPKCSYNCISKLETKWLDSLDVPREYRSANIDIAGKKYRVDAYDPNTNTIYEFYGDFWHGNPRKYAHNDINIRNKKTFGELYRLTNVREVLFREYNFNVISVWELDFKRESL